MAKKSRNQLRREKAKAKKQQASEKPSVIKSEEEVSKKQEEVKENSQEEYTIEQSDILQDPQYAEFRKVFQRFQVNIEPELADENQKKGDVMYDDSNSSSSDDEYYVEDQVETRMSKKQMRKLAKISIAALKADAKNPGEVEWFDADAPDPRLLVFLKQLHNAVPVPQYWKVRGGYLGGRRRVDKEPFQLPKFILDTGILEMRDTLKEDESTLKQRTRERVQPKSGQLDIDFAKLYDAFFKYQTKPPLLRYGEVYYEGRENKDEDFTDLRPGKLSTDLRRALGLPPGVPSPWIQMMKKLGPPPSYPHMAALLSGDVPDYPNRGNPIEKTSWGALQSDEESEEEEDDEEEEEEEEDDEVPAYTIPEHEDVPIESIGAAALEETESSHETEDAQPKKLFQVLEEMSTKHSGLLGPEQTAYGVPKKHKLDETESKTEGSSKEAREPREKKFRF